MHDIFMSDVHEITSSVDIARMLYGIDDMRATGNEVEIAVRNVIRRRLAQKYYVTSGHLLDSNLIVSPQFDIVVADSFRTPILYTSRDSTEFLTIESVFAIGEVKKSWYRDHIIDVSKMLAQMEKQMELQGTSVAPKGIFHFLFVASSGGVAHNSFDTLKTGGRHLPNVICVLGFGLIVNLHKGSLDAKKLAINLYPNAMETSDNCWAVIKFDQPNQAFGALYLLLHEHLTFSAEGGPSLMNYMMPMFEITPEQIYLL